MTDTTTEFIEKVQKIHGNKYDYSKVNYTSNLKEVIITCKEHGDFLQLPKTHKRGAGCKKCVREEPTNAKKITDTFIEKAIKIHGDTYDYSKVSYKKAREKVTIICKVHGDFLQTPNGHLSKENGCVKCATKKNADKFKKTTDEFIENAKKIHGDNYDYSKVVYEKAIEKVIIICKIHGDFLQTPNSHLSKESGCIKCAGLYKSNTKEFIEKAKQIYGDTYDYSKVEYKNAFIKVTIICKKHGEFSQKPNAHLNGQGCNKCGHNMSIFTNEDFIKKAKEIHDNKKYDYSKINYTKMSEKVIIICKEHGEFEQTPSNHITHEQGCQKCANNYLSNTNEFIEKAIEMHGDKYDYSNVNYVNNYTKIIIICKEHKKFEQTPQNHLFGYGCKLCGTEIMKMKQKTDTEEFIKNANIKHNNKYDYSKINYINARTKINIVCKEHGDFEQQPDSHLRGCGCPKCCTVRNYSIPQINWLNFIQLKDNIYIQHAENENEYLIPNTKYKADGYCQETNTIYEFHGDYWHGNPKIYNFNDMNNVTNCTFGELYQKTLKREQKIKEMGYNLIIIWESDWIKLIKSVRILQRNFRNSKFN